MTTHEYYKTIRSTIQPRNVIIQRTTAGSGPSSRSLTVERSVRYGALGSSAGGMGGIGGIGSNLDAISVKEARDKEKRDMQDLNERFASYIEKVRFLEAQNRKLGDELENLKTKWGKETNYIKQMYQTELDEAKRLLDTAEKDKQKLQMRVSALEDEVEILRRKLEEAMRAAEDSRDKLERQCQQLADYEAEVNLLRRRGELLDGDRDRNKLIIKRLQDSLNRARADLDNESLLHQDAENRRLMLEEEYEFLKQVYEQELRDMAGLAYRDTTNENRELWKSEMGSALKELQQIYDQKIDDMRNEMDSFYTLKIQEFRTGASRQNLDSVYTKEETIRLKSQFSELQGKLFELQSRNEGIQREIDELRRSKLERERELESDNLRLMNDVAKLRAEMESITKEMQDLLDAKLSLELEIAAYRKLLEGEQDRVGLRQVVDSMFANMATNYSAGGGGAGGAGGGGGGGEGRTTTTMQSRSYSSGGDALNVNQVVKGDMLAKTTYQRSAKGPIAISESSPDGKYVCLENTGRREESLGNWTLRRNVDGREYQPSVLPQEFKISPGAKIRIYARGFKPRDARNDLELYNVDTFGQGQNVTTRLCNPAGDERATQVQRTVYA